jgi:PIN domain nuclease of toxin-antitoxin system
LARAVLDSSAVVALLRGEPGADFVANYAGDSLISAVNLQEAIKAMIVRGFDSEIVREMLDGLELEVRAHGVEEAWAGALLYESTKTKGRGLGDRACMALAIAEGLPAITTDKVWAELAIPGLTVILAR